MFAAAGQVLMNNTDKPRTLIVVIPTYNDWEALTRLLDALDLALKGLDWNIRLLLIDDGSDVEPPLERLGCSRKSIDGVAVLTLRRNLGHQRAIATALAWVEANTRCEALVVMDGDGEDSPDDVRLLIASYEKTGGRAIVFAARRRRSEGALFQFFYHLYRGLHWALTGVGVQVGNFSLIPRAQLRRLVVVSDLWNHYAAAVFKARFTTALVPTARARRLGGRAKMNFTQLVVHGLSAISVFGDRVGVRLLIAAAVSSVVILGGLFAALTSNTSQQTGSWTLAIAAAMTTYMALNFLVAVTLFAFGVLGSRDAAAFLPARDYSWFVDSMDVLWSRDER